MFGSQPGIENDGRDGATVCAFVDRADDFAVRRSLDSERDSGIGPHIGQPGHQCHLDHVAVLQPQRLGERAAVDMRAILAAQVFQLKAAIHLPQARMPAADLAIINNDVTGLVAADDRNRSGEDPALAGHRPRLADEDGNVSFGRCTLQRTPRACLPLGKIRAVWPTGAAVEPIMSYCFQAS